MVRVEHKNRGSALSETLVATMVLATGLVAVAQVFTSTMSASYTIQQRIAATMLLNEKMEEFKSLSTADRRWNAGGTLDFRSPLPSFSDYITHPSASHSAGAPPAYLRVWQISGTAPRKLTIVVYGLAQPGSDRPYELARGATFMGPGY